MIALAELDVFEEVASRSDALARELAVDSVDLRAAMLGHVSPCASHKFRARRFPCAE